MLLILIWLTVALVAGWTLYAYSTSGDIFHPLILTLPMYLFIYGYMPLNLIETGELFSYVTEDQAVFAQGLAVAILIAFAWGCMRGVDSADSLGRRVITIPDATTLRNGAVAMGGVGMLAWLYMMATTGGLAGAFGTAYGGAWSDSGYIRDSVYLLLAALLLLLSPTLCAPRSYFWWATVVAFATPWVLQATLGARRGPTFVLAVGLGVSWYLARRQRPTILFASTAGAALGLLMLFLVSNRSAIYIGSDQELTTEKMTEVAVASESNEYIFSVGCITTARETGRYFWGRRVLAQVFVRPIPRAIWPTKYEDTVPELEQNSGVAGAGLETVMGWREVPGAAAAMVADTWVEFSWGAIPVCFGIGWAYGYWWRRAVTDGGRWGTQYVILLLLSVYLITQALEAFVFRLIILSVATEWIWRRSERAGAATAMADPAQSMGVA